MKNTVSKLSVLAVFISVMVVISCTKSTDELTEVNQISDTEVEFRSFFESYSIDDVDGYLAVEVIGRIGICEPNAMTFLGSFNNKMDDAGDLFVEGIELDKIQEGDTAYRYLKYISPDAMNIDQVVASGSIHSSFQSEMPGTYASFSESFTLPSNLCVETSIGASGVLSRDSDLTISWNPDEKTEKLYVAICTPGIPCILKEFSDSGNATISSGEFSNFESGEDVFLYIGRALGSVIEQSNGTKIGVIRGQWVNYPGLQVE